jgi:hypothetical protein
VFVAATAPAAPVLPFVVPTVPAPSSTAVPVAAAAPPAAVPVAAAAPPAAVPVAAAAPPVVEYPVAPASAGAVVPPPFGTAFTPG